MSSPSSSGPRNAAAAGARCRACGSRLRPTDTWCSLCHTSVAPVGGEAGSGAGPEPAGPLDPGLPSAFSGPSTPTGADRADPVAAADPADPADPVATPDSADPVAAADPVVAADRLLAELAAAEAERARESGVGALQRKLGLRGGLLIAVAGGAALLIVGILGLTLLGMLL
jgi:hypothetical protein